jgi:tyrosine-protein kinase Etk/Wzc
MEDFKDYFEPNSDDSKNSFSVREQVEYYISYWRWISLSIILFVIGAFLFIKYSTPLYEN